MDKEKIKDIPDLPGVYMMKAEKGGVLYIGIENRYAATYLHNAKDHNKLKYTTFMPRFLADWVTRMRKGRAYRTYTYGKLGYERLLKKVGR